MHGGVLFADDDRQFVDAMRREAQATTFTLFACATANEAIELLASREFDVLVLNGTMFRRRGFDLIAALRTRSASGIVLIIEERGDGGKYDPAVIHALLGRPAEASSLLDLISAIYDAWIARCGGGNIE